MTRRPRVAFVVQRCGPEVNGGAESLCFQVALALRSIWDLDILTTCAVDYMTWKNEYPPGLDEVDGVRIRRFAVDTQRDIRLFDFRSQRVLAAGSALTLEEGEAWMREQGPNSAGLLEYLERHGDEYDVVFFFTYLYATTYFGLSLVADRAVLVPFAHDEWPIHLPMWDEFFRLPQVIVFSTLEERDFLRERFSAAVWDGPIVGAGVTVPSDVSAERFRQRFGIQNPFLLYVGRIDPSKGCEQLLLDFARYKEVHNDDLMLMLVGREMMPVQQRPYLRSLGFVDEQAKFDAISACEALVMPSALESLSLALLEAWALRRPTLSNAASKVLVGQSQRSNGGLWYTDTAEFVAALSVLRDRRIAAALGQSGEAFVVRNYGWDTIVSAYVEVAERIMSGKVDSERV